MKTLTLDDLSRDELLAWIRKVNMFRVQQEDLLSVRWNSLLARTAALDLKWAEAEKARARALQAWFDCKGNEREKNRLDRIHLDLKDAAKRARRAAERARREEQACWAALEAEWKRDRA